jgi:hypothetical protein
MMNEVSTHGLGVGQAGGDGEDEERAAGKSA